MANAGSYTMPDESALFPYGMPGRAKGLGNLRSLFALPVALLLGGADTKRRKPLDMSPMADAQGKTRLERGREYYRRCLAAATELGCAFNWQPLQVVPGVGHDGGKMG
eukprot:SAG31_NODE_1807_length_7230_cov_4.804885_1_plen_107_part_10